MTFFLVVITWNNNSGTDLVKPSIKILNKSIAMLEFLNPLSKISPVMTIREVSLLNLW